MQCLVPDWGGLVKYNNSIFVLFPLRHLPQDLQDQGIPWENICTITFIQLV